MCFSLEEDLFNFGKKKTTDPFRTVEVSVRSLQMPKSKSIINHAMQFCWQCQSASGQCQWLENAARPGLTNDSNVNCPNNYYLVLKHNELRSSRLV